MHSKISFISLINVIIMIMSSCSLFDNNDPDIDNKNDPDTLSEFTAIVDDTLWSADDYLIEYNNGHLGIKGSSIKHNIMISCGNTFKTEQTANYAFTSKNFYGHSYSQIYSKFKILKLDTVNFLLSADFEFTLQYYVSAQKSYTLKIREGKIRNLKIEKTFCPISFEVKQGNFDKLGKWYLYEIFDTKNQKVFYPPCKSPSYIQLSDTLMHGTGDSERKSFSAYCTCNYYENVYMFQNGNTIITFQGFSTKKGCAFINDFESFYFKNLSNDTFHINWHDNLMEMKNTKGIELRYYK